MGRGVLIGQSAYRLLAGAREAIDCTRAETGSSSHPVTVSPCLLNSLPMPSWHPIDYQQYITIVGEYRFGTCMVGRKNGRHGLRIALLPGQSQRFLMVYVANFRH